MITVGADGQIYRDDVPVTYNQLSNEEKKELDKLTPLSTKGANVTTRDATTNFSIDDDVESLKDSQKFYIKSLISGYNVELKGAFSDIQMNWNLNWNEENVYGRIDPIPTYSGTTRDISLSLELITPAASAAQQSNVTLANHQLLQIVANMCYPGYDIEPGQDLSYNSATLKASPLVAIYMAGVIQSGDGGYLKAYMKSFSITHQAKGLFELGVGTTGDTTVFYKRMTANFSFGILHDQNIGYQADGTDFDPEHKYPFGNKLSSTD